MLIYDNTALDILLIQVVLHEKKTLNNSLKFAVTMVMDTQITVIVFLC